MSGVSGFDSSISGAGDGVHNIQGFETTSSPSPPLQLLGLDAMSESSQTQEFQYLSALPPPTTSSSISIADFAKTVQIATNELKDSHYFALLVRTLLNKGFSAALALGMADLFAEPGDTTNDPPEETGSDPPEETGSDPPEETGSDPGDPNDDNGSPAAGSSTYNQQYFGIMNSVLNQYLGITKLTAKQIKKILELLSEKPDSIKLELDTAADFGSAGVLGHSKMIETVVSKMVFKHSLSAANKVEIEMDSIIKLLLGEDTLSLSLNLQRPAGVGVFGQGAPGISASIEKLLIESDFSEPLLTGLFEPGLFASGLSSDFTQQLFDLFRSTLTTQSLASVGPAAGFLNSQASPGIDGSTVQIALAFGFLEAALALIQSDQVGVLELAKSSSGDLSKLPLTEEQVGQVNQLLSQGVSLAEALGQVLAAAGSEVFNALVAFLAEHPELSALPSNTQGQTIQSIADLLILNLGLISLAQVSKALDSPGLTGQVLSLLPGIQGLGSNVLSPPVFRDFAPFVASSRFAIALLLGSGIDASEAGSTLVEALNRFDALSVKEQTPEGFIAVFAEEFTAAGMDGASALELAKSLANGILSALEQKLFTQAELNSPLLLEAFTQELLAKAAAGLGIEDAANLAKAVLNDLVRQNLIQESLLQSSILNDFRLNGEISRSAIQANLLASNTIKDNILRDDIMQSIIRRDTTLRQIRDALRNELNSQGYTLTDAANKASAIIDRLREDFALQEQAQLALSEQSAIRFSLEQGLIRQGIAQDRAIEAAQLAFEDAKKVQGALSSQEAFRDAVASSLVSQGIVNIQLAREVAGQVTFAQTIPEFVALQNFTVAPGITKEELGYLIHSLIVENTIEQLGKEKADLLATNLVFALLDDNKGLTAVLDGVIKQVNERDEERATSLLSDIVRFITRPNRELYAFIEQLRDPANSLIYSAGTGIMYVDSQPDNYKKSIDIIV